MGLMVYLPREPLQRATQHHWFCHHPINICMEKYFLIYKTTNQINQKFYIGKHETFNLNDGYLGSGIAITAAIKKYGKNNFNKEILYLSTNRDDMDLLEKKLVTEEVLANTMCYNIALGGQGGNLGTIVNKKISMNTSKALQGKRKTDNHRQAISKALLAKEYTHASLVKQKISKTVKFNWQLLSESERKEKFGRQGEHNSFYNKSHTEQSLNKMRATIGDSRKGSKHPCAKPVTINGVTYKSRVECMQDLGINKRQFYKILGEL